MLSLSCANCHGTDGKSTTIPKIAGLIKNYMYQTLLEYKTGKELIQYDAKAYKGFTDEELEQQLSYYFQS